MISPFIGPAITAAGGIAQVARDLELSAEGVRVWLIRGLPDKRVLWLSERTGWAYTPHQLAPDLYPHPDDGLPTERRSPANDAPHESAA